MEEEKIVLHVCGEERRYAKGTPYLEIAEEYQSRFGDDIVLASVDNRLCELHKKVKKAGTVSFVTTADRAGRKTYRRSVTLLMQKALYNILGRGDVRSSRNVLYQSGVLLRAALLWKTG